MASPDADDFLDIKAAELWKKNPKEAEEKARHWTKLYASPK